MKKKDFIKRNEGNITVGIHIVFFMENNMYVAYCPALDLSSYGDSLDEAKNAFHEAVGIFIEETERKGTLDKILLSLGWTLRKKPNPEYKPPSLRETCPDLLRKDYLSELTEQVVLPV